MTIEFRIDEAVGLRVTRVTGQHTDVELLAFTREIAKDPRHDPTHMVLVDFRAVENFEITAGGLRSFAEEFESRRGTSKRASVVATQIGHGMMRMLQAYGDGDPQHFRIFEDMEAAKAWLGLPQGYRTPFERDADSDGA